MMRINSQMALKEQLIHLLKMRWFLNLKKDVHLFSLYNLMFIQSISLVLSELCKMNQIKIMMNFSQQLSSVTKYPLLIQLK